MRSVNAHNGQFPRNLVTWVSLAAVLLLTSTPVCGSVVDVDAAACCSHHTCSQPASTYQPQSGATQEESEKACCPATQASSGSSADLCCAQGPLNYPSVKVQAAASLT